MKCEHEKPRYASKTQPEAKVNEDYEFNWGNPIKQYSVLAAKNVKRDLGSPRAQTPGSDNSELPIGRGNQ